MQKKVDSFHDIQSFPDLEAYSDSNGRDTELLKEAFKVESHFHTKILSEKSAEIRESLYLQFYSELLPLYGRDAKTNEFKNPKLERISKFRTELEHQSIIDFGCGEGLFLKAAREINTKSLTGVDAYIPDDLKNEKDINFIESSIINFKTEEKYSVAFSDNVIEHLAPMDVNAHLKSVFDSLEPNGQFILIMPNRLFGPHDITRIVDNSFSGRIPAMGGHLNESTYQDMITQLKRVGFKKFKSILPTQIFPPHWRISPSLLVFIEKSPLFLRLFKSIKKEGQCKVRFTITLLCEK